jgi:mannose-P-dolichol utilization defect protein 1
VDDNLILYGYVAGFVLNAVLAVQMVYYWNAPSKKVEEKQTEKPAVGQTTATPSKGKGRSPTTRRRA